MSEWLMVCEAQEVDLVKAFHEIKTFSFPMKEEMAVDDRIYIYMKAPFDAILYQVMVTDVNRKELPDYERHYYAATSLEGIAQYFTVELIEKFSPDLLTLEFLEKNGLTQLLDFALLSDEVAYSIEYHEAEGETSEEEEEVTESLIDEMY